MLDITNIPPPRIPILDERTGLMSREWYRFFLSLFRLTGSGSNDITLDDIQLAPQSQVDFGDLNDSYNQAQLSAICSSNQQEIIDLQNRMDTAPVIPQFGTVSNYNFDNQSPTNGVLYSSTSIKTSQNLQFNGTSLGVGVSPTALIHGYSATSAVLRMEGDSTTQISSTRASDSVVAPGWFLRKSRGTIALPAAVNSGDFIGTIQWSAYGGSNFRVLGDIRCMVDTYVSDTNISSYLNFFTCPAGSSTATERFRITSTGNMYNVAGGTAGMTDGFFYIPAATGAPTSVPTVISGTVPMYYDTTNNKFYVYNGAWKSVTLT